MKQFISALIIGLIFGIGLIISGMTNPAKVIGFLDITGQWDPSLAFVMIGAIGVAFFAFKRVSAHPVSMTGENIQLPNTSNIDKRLIIGAALFGMGWGLAGYCPGPALASLSTGLLSPVLFVVAMLAGMVIVKLFD